MHFRDIRSVIVGACRWSKRTVRGHMLACLCAAAIGILMLLPIFIFQLDSSYQGIEMFGTDGESSYIAQVHAVYNGNFSFGNVFLYEYQDQPYVKQPLPAIITAGLGKLFRLSVPSAIIAAKFVFPFITFLLVYALGFVLTKRKGIALLGAAFVLLSPATTALLDPAVWKPLLTAAAFPGSDPQFLLYSRPISPQMSNMIFFAYLLLLWLFLDRKNQWNLRTKWVLGILAAVLLGLSFYTYLFAYSLLFAITGFLWLYFVIRKDWKTVQALTLIGIGGLVVGIPYILNMLSVFASPYYADLSVRVGQVATHEFLLSRVWFGVLFVYFLLYRKLDSFGIFVITFLAAIFAVSNIQVIIGRTIPIPEHFHWYYMAPLSGLILFHILFSLFEKRKYLPYLKVVKAALLIGCFVVALLFQRWSYVSQQSRFVEWNRYGEAVGWLSEHTTKEDVIFSNLPISEFIVVYTSANTYYNPYAGDALLPAERLRRAYYTYMFLDGVSPDAAEAYFADEKNKTTFSNSIFSNYWRAKNGCYACYPEELNKQFIEEYQTFANEPFLQNLQMYRITYIVWDKEKDAEWNLERFFNDVVYEDDRIVIYQIF